MFMYIKPSLGPSLSLFRGVCDVCVYVGGNVVHTFLNFAHQEELVTLCAG